MFGKRRSKEPSCSIVLLNDEGRQIAIWATGEYPLPEEVVIALSIEYYDDPEPCHIHRSAVQKRAVMELLEHCPVGHQMLVNELPERERRYFAPGVCALRVE